MPAARCVAEARQHRVSDLRQAVGIALRYSRIDERRNAALVQEPIWNPTRFGHGLSVSRVQRMIEPCHKRFFSHETKTVLA